MTLTGGAEPRADLFVADGLHFNEAGYRLLAGLVRPALPPVPTSAPTPK